MEMTVIHGLSTNPTDKEDTCTDCVGVIFLFCEFSGSMVLRNSQLMLKNIIQHSPTNNIFFVTLHLIHRPKELATVNQYILQRCY